MHGTEHKIKPKNRVYRGAYKVSYIAPYVRAGIAPGNLDRKSTGNTGAHCSTHPQGKGEQWHSAPTHNSNSTTQTHHRQGRQGTEHTTGQGHSTTQKHSTQKKEQVRTQSDIEMCYSDSVEHKGTDHTVTPNHSTCSPQRGHGTRHQSLRCVLFCVQAGHGQCRRYYPDPKCNAGRGRRGFFADKIQKNFTISLRKAGKEAWKWIRN